MSFTSLTFWSFFALVLSLYWLIRQRLWQNLLLLVASYIFYGWVSPWLAFMLGVSTIIDFFLALGMHSRSTHARLYMGLSLVFNIGTLVFFKYFNFFSDDLARVLGVMGIENDFLLIRILLPAGLSFYTLKKLSYTLDVWRRIQQPVHTLIDFALYVSFFPQIVAGPIERLQKFLPQLETQRVWKAEYFYSSWTLLLMGLFKKIVIADSIKIMVDKIFGLENPSIFLLAMGALAFTLQILVDFSGYTDIARGIAFLLGFETSENFNLPYLSLTPTDFWNRWHITLSTWLRDYVFFPLRRVLMRSRIRRSSWLITSIPPIATMVVSGLWHGAGWTYFLWGLYYGVLISAYQLLGIRGDWRSKSTIGLGLAWLVMFCFIVFGWAIFRAPSLLWLGDILFHTPFIKGRSDLMLGLITFSMVVFYSAPLLGKLILDKFPKEEWFHAAYYALVTALLVVFLNSSSPDFIYFQF